MTAESNYGPQRRYYAKQRQMGNVKVTAWVPEAAREHALKYMEKLRSGEIKPGALKN